MSERHAALSISLPRPLRKFVEQRVRSGGFGNVSEYIRSLIRADQGGTAATPALRGLGPRARPAEAMAVRETAHASPTVVDFAAEQWRELRAALLTGEPRLMARRLAEVADLWHAAMRMRRAAMRRETPDATEEQLDERLAACVHEMAQEPEDPHLVSNPERLARILRG